MSATDTAASTAAKLIERFAAPAPAGYKPKAKCDDPKEWFTYLGKLHRGSRKYARTVAKLKALGYEVQP